VRGSAGAFPTHATSARGNAQITADLAKQCRSIKIPIGGWGEKERSQG
jgi:hypothetical protein